MCNKRVFAIIGIIFISINLQHFAKGAPVESEKESDDQFIFVLPGAEAGSNPYNGLPFSLDLQPPLEAKTRVAKDSYGNPIQSYETIGEVQTAKNGKKVVQANGVQFELPSYASGITGIKVPTDELLPPLTSEEQKDLESDTTYPTDSNSSDLSSDPTSSPSSSSSSDNDSEIDSSKHDDNNNKDKPEAVSSPSVDLLPPLLDDKKNTSNTNDVSTNEISSPKENSTSGRNPTASRAPTGRSINITRRNDNGVKGNNQSTRGSTQASDNGKYTGGFGGPPGILGEQTKPGYGVVTTKAPFRSRTTSKTARTTTPITTTTITTPVPSTAVDSDYSSTDYDSSSTTGASTTEDDIHSTPENEHTNDNTEASALSTVDDNADTTQTPVASTDESFRNTNTETLSTHDYKTSTAATTTTTRHGHTSTRKHSIEAPKRRISPLSKSVFDSFTSTTPASTTIKQTSRTFSFTSSTTRYTTKQAPITSTTTAPSYSSTFSAHSKTHSPDTFDGPATLSQSSPNNDDVTPPSILLSPPLPPSSEETVSQTTSLELSTKPSNFESNPASESSYPYQHTQPTENPTPNRFAFGLNRALTDTENNKPSQITTPQNQISSTNANFGSTPSNNQPDLQNSSPPPIQQSNNYSPSPGHEVLPANQYPQQTAANNNPSPSNWQNPAQPPVTNSHEGGAPSQNPSQDKYPYGDQSKSYSNGLTTEPQLSNSYQTQPSQFGARNSAPISPIAGTSSQTSPQNYSPSNTFSNTYPANTRHEQQSATGIQPQNRFSFEPFAGSFPQSNPYAPHTQQTSPYTPQYNNPNSPSQQTNPQNSPNGQLFPSPFPSNNFPNFPTQTPYSQNPYQNQYPTVSGNNDNASNYPNNYNTRAPQFNSQNQGAPQATNPPGNQSPYTTDKTYNQNSNAQNFPTEQVPIPSINANQNKNVPSNPQQQFGYNNNQPYNPYQPIAAQQYPNSVQNRFNPNSLNPNFNAQTPQLSSPSPFQPNPSLNQQSNLPVFTPFTPQQNTHKINVPQQVRPGGTFDFQGNPFISAQQSSANGPGSALVPNYGNNLNTGSNSPFTGTGTPIFGFENPSSFLAPSPAISQSPPAPSIPSSSSAFHSQSSSASLSHPSNVNSNNNNNNNNNDDEKYSGSFGGASGILGEQQRPGYAVQPDGSIKDPDHAYKPTATGAAVETPSINVPVTSKPSPSIPVPQNSVSPAAVEKYSGGFGGPPGILSPYDNQKSG